MDIVSLLKNKQLKTTKARVAVLDLLQKNQKPLDAQTIFQNLKNKNININLVTVYRILEILVAKKIIKQLDFREGKLRYELEKEHHHHLICQFCGDIKAIHGACFKQDISKIKQDYNFLVKDHVLEFFGICKNCQ